MNIDNELTAEMKDIIEKIKNTISIISVIQGNIELDPDGVCLEDIARSLYIVWDKQNEYVNLLENILANAEKM